MSNQSTESTQSNQSTQSKSDFKSIILRYVKLLQLKSNTVEFQNLKKNDPATYNTRLGEFVPEFSEQYPSLFNMIIDGADMNMLNLFLDNLNDIDNGKKSLNEARNELGHILHNKYVKK